jgi:hypothetical protein
MPGFREDWGNGWLWLQWDSIVVFIMMKYFWFLYEVSLHKSVLEITWHKTLHKYQCQCSDFHVMYSYIFLLENVVECHIKITLCDLCNFLVIYKLFQNKRLNKNFKSLLLILGTLVCSLLVTFIRRLLRPTIFSYYVD